MRNEAAFWGKVRGVLHDPHARRVARKLTDAFTAGTPDCFYIIDGITGFLELKYLPTWPKREDTPVSLGSSVSAEQRRYLEMLVAAGAPAHVLLGIGRDGTHQDLFLIRVQDLPPGEPQRVPRAWLAGPTIARPAYGSLVEALRLLRQAGPGVLAWPAQGLP